MLVTWRYRPRGSLMDRIDPRARWIFSLLMLVTITFFWDPRILAVLAVIAFTWYFSSRISWREVRRVWLFVSIIFGTMIVVNTLIAGSASSGILPKITHPWWSIHWTIPLINRPFNFTLTVERAVFAVIQALRVLPISALFLIIPFTMDPRIYGYTFRRIGFPDRLAYSMDLAFRYVPTLARDFGVTLDAQKARGYEIERVEGGIITQVRKVAPLVVPITMNSIMSGEDVTNAMNLRCFGIRKRTWIQSLTYSRFDYALIALAVTVFVTGLVLSYGFHLGGFWMPAWLVPGG